MVREHATGLLERGFEITSSEDQADLIITHAVSKPRHHPVDVYHSHGLYPTADLPPGKVQRYHSANWTMIQNALNARAVICCANWTADIFRRDMHIDPFIVGNGIHYQYYRMGSDPHGFILWAKTNTDGVCSPEPLLELARGNPGLKFASVVDLRNSPSNLSCAGKMKHDEFALFLSRCSIYLGTTKENNSVATMEALASGVPVVGYDWGFNSEHLISGVGCELVPPGDLFGLQIAVEKVLRSHEHYSKDAREYAKRFDWSASLDTLADIYSAVAGGKLIEHFVSIVIPCHNYGKYVGEAIQSALDQATRTPFEVIVVDDASTDDSREVAARYPVELIASQENIKVARARNLGVQKARGDLIVCLDADDKLRPGFIETLVTAFDLPAVGIAYTPITRIHEESGSRATWFKGDFNFSEHMAGRNQVPSCCMFRKEAWLRAGGYRDYYNVTEDADLWARIAGLGYKVKRVGDEPHMLYIDHAGSSHRTREYTCYYSNKDWVFKNMAIEEARPVRNYDEPLVTFLLEYSGGKDDLPIIETLDSIEFQVYPFWKVAVINHSGSEIPATLLKGFPFVDWRSDGEVKGSLIHLEPGRVLEEHYLDSEWLPEHLDVSPFDAREVIEQ